MGLLIGFEIQIGQLIFNCTSSWLLGAVFNATGHAYQVRAAVLVRPCPCQIVLSDCGTLLK